MSKNYIEIEGSALNLSLSGSTMNHSKINKPQAINKKPPSSYTNRSSLSSRSNSIVSLEQTKTKETSAATPVSRFNWQSNDKKPKLPLAKKSTEKENQIKESNIFTPLSVRSSADDMDLSKIQSDFSKKSSAKNSNGLELFFGRQSNGLTNFEVIDPIKDEKINKLQSSVETLRKALHNDTKTNEKDLLLMKKVENTKRKLAAIKIQTWYRRNAAKQRSKRLAEMEKLFSVKKNEMEKKIQAMHDQEKTKTKAFSFKDKSINNSKNQKPTTPRQLKASDSSSFEPAKPDSTKQNAAESESLAASNKTLTEPTNTVESLLLSLNKIEQESADLLKMDISDKNKNYSDSMSSISSDLANNEKVNSILSFLNEASSTTNDSNNFVPKSFKEYSLDFSQFYDNLVSKKTTQQSNHITSTETSATTPRPKFNNSLSMHPSQKENENSSIQPKKTKQSTINKPTANSVALSARQQQTKTKNEIKDKQNQEKDEEEISAFSREIELNEQILANRLELEEKKRTITMLEKALSQQKELTIRHTQEADKEMQIRLESQKNDYEATIQRHLGFIDQLIDDKKNLSVSCERLVKELKDVEKTYSDKFRVSEERHKVEMQKLKDTFEAAEKIRREKWIDEKTKKIKEMTVKALEPEIQGLISKHKNELKTIKSIHDAEILQADERAAQRYIRITEELRENYEREKEASIQKERDICRQRYEKSLEEEEKSFLEQRRRLYAEIEEEKNRIAEQGASQRRDLDRLKKSLEENNLNSIETIRREYLASHAEVEAKHQLEIKNLKEKLDIEKQSWEQNYLKKQENWIIQKERELKDQLRKERDREIEILIGRLESESSSSRDEAERAAENRIKRIRDKYESELKEVEKTERDTMERYNNLKAKYNEIEGEYERLKVVVKQKEKDMEGIKKLTDVLQDERNRLADVIRQDFSDRLVFTEEENKRIKLEMVELKSRHNYELDKKKEEFDKLQKEKAEELDTVHEKIKQVIAKKDETVAQIKQQYEAACKRADHLEGLLEQSRALMLKKQTNNQHQKQ